MLNQFLNTTKEIEYLLADNWVPSQEKVRLKRLQGQQVTQSHLTERERVLEDINNKLAEYALQHSTATTLNASTLGLSRLPSSILSFIQENQKTLTLVYLRNNNLTSVPAMLFDLPNLQSIELENNRLSQEINTLQDKKVVMGTQKEEEQIFATTQRVYTPGRLSVEKESFQLGPQVPSHIVPELHTHRDKTPFCHIL